MKMFEVAHHSCELLVKITCFCFFWTECSATQDLMKVYNNSWQSIPSFVTFATSFVIVWECLQDAAGSSSDLDWKYKVY